MYANYSIQRYLNEVASKSPVPGGGSVAALTGALGITLLSKVINFTIGKDRYREVEQEMTKTLNSCKLLCNNFTRLCSEDARAYEGLSVAFKMPKGTGIERQERQKKIQEALREATAVPLEICNYAHRAIKLCLPVARKGNINLITDVACAGVMLKCAFQSALLNVEINLKSIKDDKFILEIRRVLEPMEEEVSAIARELTGEVEKYLKK